MLRGTLGKYTIEVLLTLHLEFVERETAPTHPHSAPTLKGDVVNDQITKVNITSVPRPSPPRLCHLCANRHRRRREKTALGPSGKYTIGVLLAPNLESVERAKAANPVQAAGMAFEETAMLATKTLDSFVHLASTGDAEGV